MIMTNALTDITALLGAPAYQKPGVMLYHADCIEVMRKLPDGIFNLTVTSPPYNIGKEYEHPSTVNEYLDWCERWINEVHRLTRPAGAFWLNLGYYELPGRAKALPIPYTLWQRMPFYIIQEIVWNYGAGVAGRTFFSPRNEKFLWCVKDPANYTFNLDAVRDKNVKYPNQKKNGKLKCNPLGKNPTDVWEFPKVTSGEKRASKERTPHPAQFPIAVIDRIVKACSNAGDLVFDPFMGSGTTAEACLANNRRVVGTEISAEYLDVSTKRLDAYLKRVAREKAQLLLPFGK